MWNYISSLLCRALEFISLVLVKIEETAVGFALAWVFFTVARFVPIWYDAGFLVVLGLLLLYLKDYKKRQAWLTGVVLSWFLLFLGEPSAFAFGASGIAVLLWLELIRRAWMHDHLEPSEIHIFGRTFAVAHQLASFSRWGVAVLAPLVLGFVLFWTYGIIQSTVLPAMQPYSLAFAKYAPAIFALFALVVEAFATLRAPNGDESNHWLATPVMSFLFILLFMPTHSYLGASVTITVGIALSVFAYMDRSTIEMPHRSHKTFLAASAVSLLFCGWFYIANNTDWLYKYQMANAVRITHIDRLPQSTPGSHRVLPLITAPDYCADANDMSYTALLSNPRPIFINSEGDRQRLYWQCMRIPTRMQNHVLTYPASGIEGLILVDGGKTGRFSTTLDLQFVYGEHSPVLKAAFVLRHPFAQMQPAVVGRTVGGDYYLLVPYTSWGLQWGGMIPVFSGVMVVSQSGHIVDMTPAMAGEKFPGVPLFPTALAREYAKLWAENSSLYAMQWSGELLEISDSNNPEDNLYPNYQSFATGIYGVIPFEPQGTNATALKAIGLSDRVTGDLQIYYTDLKANYDIGSNGEHDLPGPAQIIANVSTVLPGQNYLKLNGATLVVSGTGKIHWLSALMQTNMTKNHGFANGVLFDARAEHAMQVKTADEVDQLLQKEEAAELSRQEASHSKPAPKLEAPAPKVEAPAPKLEAPAPKVEAPAPKLEAPAPKVEAAAPKLEAPASKIVSQIPPPPAFLNPSSEFLPSVEPVQPAPKKHKKKKH